MTRGFRNDLDETVQFRIEPRVGEPGIYLELKENGRTATTVFPAGSGPVLALAILEAARVEKKLRRRFEFKLGSPGHLEAIAYELDLYIRAEIERADEAKARELAELEAEALELMNVRLGAAGSTKRLTKETVAPIALKAWLAVARRAREMRAEK